MNDDERSTLETERDVVIHILLDPTGFNACAYLEPAPAVDGSTITLADAHTCQRTNNNAAEG